MDQPVTRDDAQVVGPGPLDSSDQPGVDHLAIQLPFRHRVEVAKRPDLTGLAQAQRGVRVLDLGLDRLGVGRAARCCAGASIAGAAAASALSAALTTPVAAAVAATVAPAVPAAVAPTAAATVPAAVAPAIPARSEEHTSELQSQSNLVC